MNAAAGVRHFVESLRLALRLLEVTNRRIENRMGWSHGYLSRLFNGTIEPRLSHVFEILEILEVEPAEFFALAFPPQSGPPTEGGAQLRQLLQPYRPEPDPTSPPPVRREELAALLQRALEAFLAAEAGSPPPRPGGPA